jgi:hypothetical protein
MWREVSQRYFFLWKFSIILLGKQNCRMSSCLKQFEDYVNLNVLRKPWSKGNWHLSTNQNSNKERTIDDQGMPNTQVCWFMKAFDQLADIFFWYDEERKKHWKKAMDNWRKLMEMAGQRDNFSDEESHAFGSQCDVFF